MANREFVRFPNPDPKMDLFFEYCIAAVVIFFLMLFLVITALLSRIKQLRTSPQSKKMIQAVFFEKGVDEDHKGFRKLLCCYRKKARESEENAQCCFRRCKLGAIRFILRPYFIIMEWVAMMFLVEIYRQDWKNPKSYTTPDIEFFDPKSNYYFGIAIFFLYAVFSAFLTLGIDYNNADSRSASIILQFFGIRGVYQMYLEVEDDQDSQEMVELATIHATFFSMVSLLSGTIYGFEAFHNADNQSGWYMMLYVAMFLSMVNISRAVNYRDSFGLKRKSVFWNTVLIILRMSEIFFRVTVLGLIGAYFNKTLLVIFVSITIPIFAILRMQRNKLFRWVPRENQLTIVSTSNKFRKAVDIVNQTILDYVFFDLRWEGFSRGMNIYKIFEYVAMITLLVIKNYEGFQVFEKTHKKWPFHVFVYLRCGLFFIVYTISAIALYLSGNYSMDLYIACVENKIGELVRRKRWKEIRMLMLRLEIDILPEEFAQKIHRHCPISIKDMLHKKFSIGQLCLLRFPMEEITKELKWKQIKPNARKRLYHMLKFDKSESTKPEDSTNSSQKTNDAPKDPILPNHTEVEMVKIIHRSEIEEQSDVEDLKAHPSQEYELLKQDKEDKKFLENILSEDENGVTKDYEGKLYFQFPLKNNKYLYRLVNFILKTETENPEEFSKARFTSQSKLRDMVKELIANKINVFLWEIRHRSERDGNIDTKEYRAYNAEGSFKFFGLHCYETLYTFSSQDYRFYLKQGNEDIYKPKESERVHWKNIHIIKKPPTTKGEAIVNKQHRVTDKRFDNEEGFFVYKDTRTSRPDSFKFLQRAPPSLLDELLQDKSNGLKFEGDLQTTVEDEKKAPTIEMKKSELEPHLDVSCGKLKTWDDPMKQDLCGNQDDSESKSKMKARGWRITKLQGDDFKNFRTKWNSINDNDLVNATFIYENPGYIDCTGVCESFSKCFESCRARLDNSQQGVKPFKVGDMVRFKNYPDHLKGAFDNRVAVLKEVLQGEKLEEIRIDRLQEAGLPETSSIRVWDCYIHEYSDGKIAREYITKRTVAEYFFSKVNKDGDKYIVDLPEGNWGFQIDMYDWTVVITDVDRGAPQLKDTGVKEGWELEYIEYDSKDEDGVLTTQKLYVNDVKSQKKVVGLLNKNQKMTMKFIPPENENTCGAKCAFCIFSSLCCVPCAWLSFRPYCGLGGQKYSAKELITYEVENQENGTREYLVDDGDILLVSCANPGWLSLSQGGQWGHCGIIYRYKEMALPLLPDRFQEQLKNWKERGIVEEGTPLVFEMANHVREKDTNDFKVHLSHLQNWHMFRDTKKYFGATVGIRKFTGKRDRAFYLALFQTMRQHHMKPYESVPMEFICSGLCFFPKTPFAEQIEELFCSELVALLYYNLKGENPETQIEEKLIPDWVFPSEFQPADFGENKTCFPFFFMCCCRFSYWVCSEQRQAWRHNLKNFLGKLLILDISSVAEWEDEVKSVRRKKIQKKSIEKEAEVQDYHLLPVRYMETLRGFGASHSNLLDDDDDDVNEAVRRKRIREMHKQTGCSTGIFFVEMTWWVFYLFTFPVGLYIRIRTQLVAIDAAEKEAESNRIPSIELRLNARDSGSTIRKEEVPICLQSPCYWNDDRKTGCYLLATGIIYMIIAISSIRAYMGKDRMSLWELPLYLYYLSIISLGIEGLCGIATRNCYDAMFRCGFRLFGIRLKEHSESYAKQIDPVKIPFLTSITFSAACVITFVLENVGYKQELEFDFVMPNWYFIGALLGILITLYLLCQYVIRSAIEMAGMLEDLQPSIVESAQTMNTIVEFRQASDALSQERQANLEFDDSLPNLQEKLEDEQQNYKRLQDEITLLDSSNWKEDTASRNKIIEILVREQKKKLQEDSEILEAKLEKLKEKIDILQERKKENEDKPTWFFSLSPEDREDIGNLAYSLIKEGEDCWREGDIKDLEKYDFKDKEDLNKAWEYLLKKNTEQAQENREDCCEEIEYDYAELATSEDDKNPGNSEDHDDDDTAVTPQVNTSSSVVE